MGAWEFLFGGFFGPVGKILEIFLGGGDDFFLGGGEGRRWSQKNMMLFFRKRWKIPSFCVGEMLALGCKKFGKKKTLSFNIVSPEK